MSVLIRNKQLMFGVAGILLFVYGQTAPFG